MGCDLSEVGQALVCLNSVRLVCMPSLLWSDMLRKEWMRESRWWGSVWVTWIQMWQKKIQMCWAWASVPTKSNDKRKCCASERLKVFNSWATIHQGDERRFKYQSNKDEIIKLVLRVGNPIVHFSASRKRSFTQIGALSIVTCGWWKVTLADSPQLVRPKDPAWSGMTHGTIWFLARLSGLSQSHWDYWE